MTPPHILGGGHILSTVQVDVVGFFLTSLYGMFCWGGGGEIIIVGFDCQWFCG